MNLHHIETERKVINLMLSFPSSTGELLDINMSTEIFDGSHRPLVQAIIDEYISSGQKRILSRGNYQQILKSQSKTTGEIFAELELHDKCLLGSPANMDDLGFLFRQIKDNYLSRSVTESMQFFTDNKKNGFMKTTSELVYFLQKSLANISVRKTVYASGKELKNEFLQNLLEERENQETVVRCGIPEIDNPVNVGFRKQHLTLFVADVGGHKTNMMINVALNLIDKSFKVLFIPLEMNRDDLLRRMVANRVGISGDSLAHPQMLSDDDVQKITHSCFWDKMENLYILDADEKTSVSTLKMEIENKASEFKPKVVIVDYIANLEPDKSYGQKHIEIGDILTDLRFLGKKYDFHIISAAQMNRSAIKQLKEGKDNAVDSTAIHGSHQYSADSDTIFALLKVPGEEDKIKIYTIKARHGPSGQTRELRVDPNRYLISSTSDIMSNLSGTGFNIDDALNQPQEEIESEISGLEFNTVLDLHDEDDLSAMG